MLCSVVRKGPEVKQPEKARQSRWTCRICCGRRVGDLVQAAGSQDDVLVRVIVAHSYSAIKYVARVGGDDQIDFRASSSYQMLEAALQQD